MTTENEAKSLPENAYLPLQPGETYQPIIPAAAKEPELTLRSVFWGLLFCVLFSVASAYSGLKVGQGMEAAIPISILAIGLARVFKRRTSLLENVIITGIGAASGSVVAGAIFTLPALYILHLNPHPVQTIFICLAGGCLGVLFLIPLRRYFTREMHGQLPFPEATAITEVLVTGENGGSQAKLLLQATAVGGVYDFFVTTFHVWREYVDFQFVPVMRTLADKGRMVFNFDAIGFILGLGYVMGLRSSLIFCAGGILSNFVLVPLIWFVGGHLATAVYPAAIPIAQMTRGGNLPQLCALHRRGSHRHGGHRRHPQIDARGRRLLRHCAARLPPRRGRRSGAHRPRHADHLHSSRRGAGRAGGGGFLRTLSGLLDDLLVGLVLTLLFSFFFTSVAANAIATTADNPASGMTMLTIIISALVLLNFGLSGTTGMFFVMAIAGMVCTALCVSGQFITDLKAGYWLGSTPAAQQKVKFLGVIAAAIAAGLTIVLLAHTFQFGEAAPGDVRRFWPRRRPPS